MKWALGIVAGTTGVVTTVTTATWYPSSSSLWLLVFLFYSISFTSFLKVATLTTCSFCGQRVNRSARYCPKCSNQLRPETRDSHAKAEHESADPLEGSDTRRGVT